MPRIAPIGVMTAAMACLALATLPPRTAYSTGLLHSDPNGIAVSGVGIESIDAAVRKFMVDHDVPGYALAIAIDERLVVARGYGMSDIAQGETVQPDSLFRVASISKPITAVAAMTLYQSGYLDLDASAFERYLPDLFEVAATDQAASISAISMANLVSHTSGWQFRDFGRDMVFDDRRIANVLGVASPPGPENVIRYVLEFERLHATPGLSYRYDNFNFMVAGRVIESITARPYEDYVRARVFAPVGVHRTRVGGSLIEERHAGEVRYYTRGQDDFVTQPVFDGHPGPVPFQYGGWNQQGLDSVGGWVASAPDLVRMMTALDAMPEVPDLLDDAARERMGRNPGFPVYPNNAEEFYSLGWGRDEFGAIWLHDGSLPGTRTIIAMLDSGLKVAALINTRELGAGQAAFDRDFNEGLGLAVLDIQEWPEHDLFEEMGYADFVVSDEISGAWYDPDHDGEGFLIEVLSADRAVVYWFTYDEAGRQRWFVGDGAIEGDRIRVGELLQPEGGRFGAAENSISLNSVGTLTLVFDECHSGRADYTVDGIDGTQQLTRLIRINGADCLMAGDPLELIQDTGEAASGSWFDLADPGEGFIVQRLSDEQAAVFWFTFDDQAAQRWMTGIGTNDNSEWQFDDLVITDGGRFGANFDPIEVNRQIWGDLSLRLDCQSGLAEYLSESDGFASGQQPLARLTFLAGQSCLSVQARN